MTGTGGMVVEEVGTTGTGVTVEAGIGDTVVVAAVVVGATVGDQGKADRKDGNLPAAVQDQGRGRGRGAGVLRPDENHRLPDVGRPLPIVDDLRHLPLVDGRNLPADAGRRRTTRHPVVERGTTTHPQGEGIGRGRGTIVLHRPDGGGGTTTTSRTILLPEGGLHHLLRELRAPGRKTPRLPLGEGTNLPLHLYAVEVGSKTIPRPERGRLPSLLHDVGGETRHPRARAAEAQMNVRGREGRVLPAVMTIVPMGTVMEPRSAVREWSKRAEGSKSEKSWRRRSKRASGAR